MAKKYKDPEPLRSGREKRRSRAKRSSQSKEKKPTVRPGSNGEKTVCFKRKIMWVLD